MINATPVTTTSPVTPSDVPSTPSTPVVPTPPSVQPPTPPTPSMPGMSVAPSMPTPSSMPSAAPAPMSTPTPVAASPAGLPPTPPSMGDVTGGVSSNNLTPKKKGLNWKMLLGGVVVLALVVGSAAGYALLSTSTDPRQQASGTTWECNGHQESTPSVISDFTAVWCEPEAQWKFEAARSYGDCGGHQSRAVSEGCGGGGSGTDNDANKCTGPGTAPVCVGNDIGSSCNGFPGICIKNGVEAGKNQCGCQPLDGSLTINQNCTSTTQCQSGLVCTGGKCTVTAINSTCNATGSDSQCVGKQAGVGQCAFQGGSGICQGSGNNPTCVCQVSEVNPPGTGGALDCTYSGTSITNGQTKCLNGLGNTSNPDRAVNCNNGNISTTLCGRDQTCANGACIAESSTCNYNGTPIAIGSSVCLTDTSYKRCERPDTFSSSLSCPTGQVCNNGRCQLAVTVQRCGGSSPSTDCNNKAFGSPCSATAQGACRAISTTNTNCICQSTQCVYQGNNYPVNGDLCFSETSTGRCNSNLQVSKVTDCASGQVCSSGRCVSSTSNNVGGGNPTPTPNAATGDMCPADSSKPAASYVKYTCPNGCEYSDEGAPGVFDWRCYENWTPSATEPTLGAGECGQIDVLDAGGAYCGHTVNTCDQPQCQPQTNPSPTPGVTPTPGPMCLNITMSVNSVAYTPSTSVQIGDSINLTCGTVPGAHHYIFRVVEADGTITNLEATGAVSAPFIITKSGQTTAQCQICTGADANTCFAFPNVSAVSQIITPGFGLPIDSELNSSTLSGSTNNSSTSSNKASNGDTN